MKYVILAAVAVAASSPLAGASGRAGKAFDVVGSYVEGCSCAAPCTCELTGPEMGCQGVGFIKIDHASYDGMDLSGVKSAYALGAGKWVVIYLDAPDSKRAAAEAFMRASLAAFGPIEAVKSGHVTMEGRDGKTVSKVDGGAVMSLTTEPILGGDGKRPLQYSNIHDPVHPVVMQGKAVSGKYNDAGHSFDLSDSNSYFNDHFATHGQM
jgi:hypothetical protein